jgi:ribonuclease Z
VLDCPSLNYIDNLLNDTITKVYCQRQENPPSCIVHQLGKGILNDPRYLNFIGQIHSETKQIFLAPELNDGQIIFYSSAELLTKLSAIDSEMFQSDNYEIHESLLDQFINSNSSLIGGTFQTELVIDPNHKLSTIPKSSSKTLLLNGYLAELSKLKEFESNTKAVNEPFPYVVTLGTGSCQPSKYRNVSSSLIALKNISILLDAGEGTLGQIYRHYGTCFDEELLKIKYIFISHLHADHHLGTFGIVKKWAQLANYKNVQQKLFISAPLPFLNWIKNYAQIESCGLENIVFVDNSDLVGKLSQENHNSEFAYLLKSLSLKSVESVPVQHCYLSYGVVIETLDGFKVSYSGDCRPSSKLAKVGEGSDLLIHEATFRDALIEEAREKNHSTVSEAIDVGLKMKAKNVLLTHFSQKYPMMTELPENKVDGITIGYAFDMMKIKMSDFWKFNYIVPILDKYLTKIEEI